MVGLSGSFVEVARYRRVRNKDSGSAASFGLREYVELCAARPVLHQKPPSGNRRSVLVIPAFSSNDLPTYFLRQELERRGHRTYGWKLGFNMGVTADNMAGLEAGAEEIVRKDGEKLVVVGHSLGAFYMQLLAHKRPDLVDIAISAFSPLAIGFYLGAVPIELRNTILEKSDPEYSIYKPEIAELLCTPAPGVLSTAIGSMTDDLVNKLEACYYIDTPYSENIMVVASHVGGIWNRRTVAITIDRAEQPRDGSQRFQPTPDLISPVPMLSWDFRVSVPRLNPGLGVPERIHVPSMASVTTSLSSLGRRRLGVPSS
jgi:pimeloyl-ACP methyl ester carboxylesterase